MRKEVPSAKDRQRRDHTGRSQPADFDGVSLTKHHSGTGSKRNANLSGFPISIV